MSGVAEVGSSEQQEDCEADIQPRIEEFVKQPEIEACIFVQCKPFL